MANKPIVSGKVTFQSEGRLLQELGERLVASAEVAIVELIKNSYDANAVECDVYATSDNKLVIKDDGHGITLDEFNSKWMRIASGFKKEAQYSRDFERKLTGAKGIGRFAVRFLGKKLKLESISSDKVRNIKTLLVAIFDWSSFDKSLDLSQVKVPYKLYKKAKNTPTGTTLQISELRGHTDVIFSRNVRTEVLKIISPLGGLERGWFDIKRYVPSKDPGFKVSFPVHKDSGKIIEEGLAENVLNNFWAKLIISSKSNKLQYKIFLPNKNKPVFKHSQYYKTTIKQGVFADIRFFPRRPGIFYKKDFKGRDAWSWIKNNSGVAVVDHGFRIKPYGYKEDDWLKISQDKAINRRDWRSDITSKHFPIPDEIRLKPKRNPMLYLPANHQLVGAAFVESGHMADSGDSADLIPSMDREGYLENKAFHDLYEIVRAGIEMLALLDKREEDRKAEEEAKLASEKARKDLKNAIEYIKNSPTLLSSDKNRIISEYVHLADNIEEVDEYHRRARQGLETMSLLGVVAGFMTHESKRILHNLEQLLKNLKKLTKKDQKTRETIESLERSYQEFRGHIDYSSAFISAVHREAKSTFKAYHQVKRIIDKFGLFAKERGIEVSIEIDKEMKTPSVPIALYSGVLINLYTNALKAVTAVTAGSTTNEHLRISFKSWNEQKKHIIEVVDNGIGIPQYLGKRIWDPLFTTTSNLNNPLGSGMGLGLSIIKKLINDIGGSVRLVDPPPGFSTCFRVEMPRK